MENASKALLIAGGVLITIIIVSVLMFMYKELTSIPKTQEEIKTAEQLAEFNKKYESYHKKNMYGTDVVTLINMARNNNKNYLNDIQYQINVDVTITSDIESSTRMWYFDTAETNSSKAVKEATSGGWPDIKDTIPAGLYHIGDSIWDNVTDPDLGEVQSEYVYSNEDGTNTFKTVKWYDNVWFAGERYRVYYKTSNLAYEFKNRKFDCTGIEYGANGRVNKLSFRQK